MRVFRTSYKDRTGRKREASRWYVEFKDHLDTVRRLPAFTSKAASEEMGRNLEKLVAYHRATGGQTDPKLSEWLVGLPPRTRDRLVAIGLLDSERVGVGKPLADHLDDFTDALRGKGDTEKQIRQLTQRIRKVCLGCGFKTFGDISAAAVWRFIGKLRDDCYKTRTRCHYLGAVRQFTKWMRDERRASDDPLAGMKPETVDDEAEAGVFEPDELRTLLTETERGPVRRRMTGFERRLLYELAGSTGFRSKECRTITWGDIDLGADPPTATVTAKHAKNRKLYDQPLTASLTQVLARCREIRGRVDPEDLVFPVTPDETRIAAMLRDDMRAAGLPECDSAARPRNFHSLRHSFGSHLARANVSPKLAMDLMRHSDVNLTLRRYSHTLLPDRSSAIQKLPDFSQPERSVARATGTSDSEPVESVLASCLAPQRQFTGAQVGASGQSGVKCQDADTKRKPRQTRRKSGFAGDSGQSVVKPPNGLEPLTCGLQNRCSAN